MCRNVETYGSHADEGESQLMELKRTLETSGLTSPCQGGNGSLETPGDSLSISQVVPNLEPGFLDCASSSSTTSWSMCSFGRY